MRSMTGYGIGRASDNGWEVSAELKTVNHRFLDVNTRLPRNIAFLEQTVRETISSALSRGHVDVFLSVIRTDASGMEVKTDPKLAAAYKQAAEMIADAVGMESNLSVKDLMAFEGVATLSEREMDQDTVILLCRQALQDALEHVIQMREDEGRSLAEDLLLHLEQSASLREKILVRAPDVVTDYRNRLNAKLKALIPEGVDPQRLAQEVALMADRCAIDEELMRLDSHISQMRTFLKKKGEIGKKMDFLIQEMNREANTIGSKASDAEITQYVVDLKSEIEKMREQIQNVE